jgi:3-carboxy-cis,cis-muconate cycloisomerase
VFDAIFTSDALLEATSDAAWIAAMLEVEAALARAEGDCGVIPQEVAERVARCCEQVRVDPAEIGRNGRDSANPVIPLVEAVRHAAGAELAGAVHYGATSQDILDTAAMLVAKKVTTLVVADLDVAAAACARLAEAHRETVLAGRTLLQPAVPTTFGLKAAGWLVALLETRARLVEVRDGRFAVSLGGAAGTLASLGHHGEEVTAALAERLGLGVPLLSWHTGRARVVELAAALGAIAGSAAKIARDVALLMQGEVAEAAEAGGRSSTMPHKRNPAAAAEILAAARRASGLVGVLFGAMDHEHERAVGAWQAEWPCLSDLFRLAGGAAARLSEMLAGLSVDGERMRENAEASKGLLLTEAARLALSAELGDAAARRLVEAAVGRVRTEKGTLADALRGDPAAAAALGPNGLAALDDPSSYLGSAGAFVERALAAYRAATGR